MKTSKLLLAGLLSAARVAAWHHATEASFRKALRSNDHTLVAFILPKQETSTSLETEWVSIQETERDNNVLSIDCGANAQICQEQHVISHPAIRIYHSEGAVIERYRGARTAKSIVGFLRRSQRPALSYVNNKNATSFISIDDVVLIGYIAGDDINLQERLETVARKYHDRYSFALSVESGSESALSCYNNLDELQKSTVELAAVDALEKFVKDCAKPLIPQLTRRNELQLASAGKSMVHYFVHNEKERESFVTAMRPLAKAYGEYLQFDTVDSAEYADMVPMMGFTSRSTEVLSVQNPSNGDVFPYTGGERISAAVVEAFLNDIISGKVPPWSGEQEDTARKHEEL